MGGKSNFKAFFSRKLAGRLHSNPPLLLRHLVSGFPSSLPYPLLMEVDLLTSTLGKAYPPPNYTVRNINPVLKRVCEKIGLPNASRYSSHAFRRGAAQELKENGSQWPTIATLGDWRSLAFRGYVDIATDIARDMSKLLAEEVAFESVDD